MRLHGPAIASFVLVVVAAVPAIGQNACDAGKLKCARSKLGCLIKVQEAALKKGLPPDAAKVQTCKDKFDGGATPAKGCLAALEGKYGTACTTTGNTAAVEAQLDGDVDALLAIFGITASSTTSTSISTTSSTSTTSTVAASTTTTTSLLSQGDLCSSSSGCSTGFCVDGVCCNTACSGLCKSCDGIFGVLPAGSCSPIDCADPDNECAGAAICTGGGICGTTCF